MDKIRDLREKFFQVNDEYLNGYAKLCGINATGVYLSMCRHANKAQKCFPSKKLIAEELAISERSVYTAINKLNEWNIILIEEQGRKKDGSFKVKLYTLLDKKCWKVKPQANGAVGKDCTPPQANDDKPPQATVAQEGNTSIKETHIKETHINGVKEIMDIFYKYNPTLNWGNRTYRKAAADLIKLGGLEATKELAAAAISIQGQPYAPTITNPWELKEKAIKVKMFFDNQKNKSNIIKV